MRSLVHKFILAPAVMAAAALATTTAKAETTLKVPFSFTVQGKTWPAGLYAVKKDGNPNRVMLYSKDGPKEFAWVICPGQADPTDTRIVLKFDASGDTHALQSIQYGPMITPRLDRGWSEIERLTASASHGR
jgi:hypothetical protein